MASRAEEEAEESAFSRASAGEPDLAAAEGEKRRRARPQVRLAVAERRMKRVMRVKSSEDLPRISATALSGMMRRRKRRVKGGVRRNAAEKAARIK